MPKCSCAGNSCSCSVVQGAGINVVGTGSAGSPFVVSLAPTPSDFVLAAPGALDLSGVGASAVARVLLQANATSVQLPTNGVRLDLLVTQDAVGGRTIAWPAAVIWPGGTDPVLTATANAADWISLIQAAGVWAGVKIGSAMT